MPTSRWVYSEGETITFRCMYLFRFPSFAWLSHWYTRVMINWQWERILSNVWSDLRFQVTKTSRPRTQTCECVWNTPGGYYLDFEVWKGPWRKRERLTLAKWFSVCPRGMCKLIRLEGDDRDKKNQKLIWRVFWKKLYSLNIFLKILFNTLKIIAKYLAKYFERNYLEYSEKYFRKYIAKNFSKYLAKSFEKYFLEYSSKSNPRSRRLTRKKDILWNTI